MNRTLIAHACATALLTFAVSTAQAQSATEAELAQRLEKLAAELATVKAQLSQATPAAPAPAPQEPATVLTSYGEINYNRPRHDSLATQIDLRRFVLGLQHRFDERTQFAGELEVEHAVSSADDVGEVEVEQAYIEHQLSPRLAARAGLMLMPLGLLNENHEPTAYYGVERNFVETAIIPSTWREGGAQLVGTLDNGVTVQGGITTGFDINKWDYSDAGEGRESPLGSIHQELALARAHDLAAFGAVNWRGIPGLHLGGGAWSGSASQGQPDVPKSRVTVWDLHARWTPDRWDVSSVYAHGSISGTAALNTLQLGSATPIPSRFEGAYVQLAYALWSRGDRALKPFARWERFNTASAFADVGAGVTESARPDVHVVTLGANFQFTPDIVIKADVQRLRGSDTDSRLDLGLGWSF